MKHKGIKEFKTKKNGRKKGFGYLKIILYFSLTDAALQNRKLLGKRSKGNMMGWQVAHTDVKQAHKIAAEYPEEKKWKTHRRSKIICEDMLKLILKIMQNEFICSSLGTVAFSVNMVETFWVLLWKYLTGW
jgi:hypothetical protein